ncbi:uncharacterized protein LOC123698388 isoform X1 [Colias croceus]|uniref:uncharacterized protein LOC123696580 isoform X1 n=1 Tax=Colias crocea TaxID=72248 RepID=UPI001E27A093|nr:uncharacterized protein LOC123696580 isoform X1 [Colias croceus]XP_045500952.1 uncharacterized protein LOC123698388 isoform X1 [Colias croceus]
MESEAETSKTKPLSKEETKGLLSLIEGSKILYNKKTNATSNKMKIEEWTRIAGVFNANIGTCRRTPQQLRLKWENLKKNSRKRIGLMRMERIKTGGGPPGYFPPDEILDRVAALLGSTGEGLTVRFGGDAEPQLIGDSDGDGSVGTAYIVPADHPMLLIDTPLPVENPTPSMDYTSVSMGNEVPANGIGDELVSLGTPNIHSIEKRNFKTSGNILLHNNNVILCMFVTQ